MSAAFPLPAVLARLLVVLRHASGDRLMRAACCTLHLSARAHGADSAHGALLDATVDCLRRL